MIHQKNQGLWKARNAGLSEAAGDYILFLDSDDILDGDDAISLLVKKAYEDDADIVQGSFRRFWDDGRSILNMHGMSGLDSQSEEFRFRGFFQKGHLSYNWGKLYRRDFLIKNDLWLRQYPFTQDKPHGFMCYAMKPNYAFLDESVFCYRMNEDSVTFKYKENFTEVWTSIGVDFMDWCREKNIGDDFFDLVAFHVFFGAFFLAEQELKSGHKRRLRRENMRSFGRIDVCRVALDDLSRGMYIRDIQSPAWRMVIKVGSVLMSSGRYGMFLNLVWLLSHFKQDHRVKRHGAK